MCRLRGIFSDGGNDRQGCPGRRRRLRDRISYTVFSVFAQREVRRDARLLALGKGGRPVGGGPSFVPVSNADTVRSPVPGASF